MSNEDSSTLFPSLPLGYSDPEAYLLNRQFHLSLKFRPSYLAAEDKDHRVTYAVVGSQDENAPTVFWMNGMGGHRMAAIIFDQYASHFSTPCKIISMDRPSTGGSTPVPLSQRARWTRDAFVAILAKENVAKVALLSHSNGVIYALHTLLNLPETVKVTSWTMCSPYVGPWLSGSLLLTPARYLPSSAVNSVGGLLKGVFSLTGPFVAASGWSSGVVRDVRDTVVTSTGFGSSETDPSTREANTPLSPAQELAKWIRKNNARDDARKQFSGRWYSSACFDLGMKWSISEGMEGMGQEALMCLKKNDATPARDLWGWGEQDENKLYDTAFRSLKKFLESRAGEDGDLMPIQVFSATDDGLIPLQGRKYLKDLLVNDLGLLKEADWRDIKGGHDDPLGREFVARTLLEVAVRGAT